MYKCRWIVGIVLTLGVQCVAESASTAPSVIDLKGIESQVRLVIAQRDPQKAAEMFGAYFGMQEFAQHCLVDYWDALSASQRQQYVDLFSLVLKTNLKHRLEKISHNDRRYSHRLRSVRRGANGTYVVTATLRSADFSGTIEYILKGNNGQLELVDYTVDGISLVRNYRGHFNHVMRKSGFDGLIADLNKKLLELH